MRRLAAAVAATGILLLSSALAQPVETPVATVEASATDDAVALTAQSVALNETQREEARSLFSTGFQLWQAGDFAAAEIAFRRGLEIDPANAVANFYYGDCLKRRGDRAGAATHFQRAIALGPNTPEAFRAEAALSEVRREAVLAEQTSGARFNGLWRKRGASWCDRYWRLDVQGATARHGWGGNPGGLREGVLTEVVADGDVMTFRFPSVNPGSLALVDGGTLMRLTDSGGFTCNFERVPD